MSSFRNNRLRDHEMPLSTVWLLNDIAESRGRQELFTRQSPQALKALRDATVIQSTESSNRIEGVTVAPDRLVTCRGRGPGARWRFLGNEGSNP